MISTLIFMCLTSKDLLMPQDMAFANYVVFDKGEFFVMDVITGGLFSFSRDGVLLSKYVRRGFGPGEATVYSSFVVRDQGVYLLDHKQMKIIFLDRKLNYLNQTFYPKGRVGGFEVAGNSIFLFYYDPVNNMLVHKFDMNMKQQSSFYPSFVEGEEIPKKNAAKFKFAYNLGDIFAFQGKLYVLHNYRYRIDVFDLSGQHLETHPIPGISMSECINVKKGTFDVVARDFRRDEQGLLYLSLVNRYPGVENGIPRPKLWMFNPLNGEWREKPYKTRWFFPAHDQQFVRTEETEKGIFLRFEPNPFSD